MAFFHWIWIVNEHNAGVNVGMTTGCYQIFTSNTLRQVSPPYHEYLGRFLSIYCPLVRALALQLVMQHQIMPKLAHQHLRSNNLFFDLTGLSGFSLLCLSQYLLLPTLG